MENSDFINFLNDILSRDNGYAFSDSDIISAYIDGKINKEEYIRRMNERRKTNK